jgi:hypothetical protein
MHMRLISSCGHSCRLTLLAAWRSLHRLSRFHTAAITNELRLLLLLLYQIAIAVLHLGRFYLTATWLSTLVSLQHVMLWFRFNYFGR